MQWNISICIPLVFILRYLKSHNGFLNFIRKKNGADGAKNYIRYICLKMFRHFCWINHSKANICWDKLRLVGEAFRSVLGRRFFQERKFVINLHFLLRCPHQLRSASIIPHIISYLSYIYHTSYHTYLLRCLHQLRSESIIPHTISYHTYIYVNVNLSNQAILNCLKILSNL